MKTLLTTAATLLALSSVAAPAATIKLHPNTCNGEERGCTAVEIIGFIEASDGGKFMELMLKDNPAKAVIILRSPGGSVPAALQIGRFIKAKSYTTYATDTDVCASSCAIIWLAGWEKIVDAGAKIGFHAAYTVQQAGRKLYAAESGMANALVGAYFAELGYSEDAIRFFTKAGPTSASWLTSDNAKRLGIEFQFPSHSRRNAKRD
jgi:hypothetical protein